MQEWKLCPPECKFHRLSCTVSERQINNYKYNYYYCLFNKVVIFIVQCTVYNNLFPSSCTELYKFVCTFRDPAFIA